MPECGVEEALHVVQAAFYATSEPATVWIPVHTVPGIRLREKGQLRLRLRQIQFSWVGFYD